MNVCEGETLHIAVDGSRALRFKGRPEENQTAPSKVALVGR